MEKNKDIEQQRINLQKAISQTYKPSLWERFKDFVGIVFLAMLLLICMIGILYVITILIENPVSLAILCLTIVFIWIWSVR